MKIEIVKFGAEWCGPCRAMKPAIEAVVKKYNVEDSDVHVQEVDVDENPEMATKYGIRSIPATVFLVENTLVEKKIGVLPAKQIEEIVENIQSGKYEQ